MEKDTSKGRKIGKGHIGQKMFWPEKGQGQFGQNVQQNGGQKGGGEVGGGVGTGDGLQGMAEGDEEKGLEGTAADDPQKGGQLSGINGVGLKLYQKNSPKQAKNAKSLTRR